MSDNVYRYVIDHNNRIISVSDNWTDFAKENNASPEVIPPDVLGKSLFDFIPDMETADIYRTIIEAVREKKTQIKIPINCDSPELRRSIEVGIHWQEDGSIEFISEIVKIEEREPVTVLDPTSPRSFDRFLNICSFCKKIQTGVDEYQETGQAMRSLNIFDKKKMPMLHQLVCPSCVDEITDRIEKMKQKIENEKDRRDLWLKP
jgi:hypothetical protein